MNFDLFDQIIENLDRLGANYFPKVRDNQINSVNLNLFSQVNSISKEMH